MSPIQMRSALAGLIITAAALAACSNTWPGPVPIDEALWDIEIESCGPVDTNTIQWAMGTVTNTGSEESPFYQTGYEATFSDGTSGAEDTGTLIPPLEPGQSYEFVFGLANSAGKEVVTCDVWIVDSVSNYTD